MSEKTTVMKLGGSLLSMPQLGAKLAALIARYDGKVMLLVGGGPPADVVREWDRIHGLTAEESHWLAIDSMSLSARLVVNLLPKSQIVRSRDEAERLWQSGGIPILEPRVWVEFFEAQSPFRLPHTWSVTSDSLAAWIAISWPADRLVMLKSIDQPAPHAAASGVDDHFEEFAARIPQVDWVNLRAGDL